MYWLSGDGDCFETAMGVSQDTFSFFDMFSEIQGFSLQGSKIQV